MAEVGQPSLLLKGRGARGEYMSLWEHHLCSVVAESQVLGRNALLPMFCSTLSIFDGRVISRFKVI